MAAFGDPEVMAALQDGTVFYSISSQIPIYFIVQLPVVIDLPVAWKTAD